MTRRLKSIVLMVPLVVLVLLGAVAAYSRFAPSPTGGPPVAVIAPTPPEATPEEVHQLCASCHAYPPPETFPRSSWRKEVKQAYDFLRDSPVHRPYPSLEAVVRYYESRAPEELPVIHRGQSPDPPAVRFEKHGYPLPGEAAPPAIANVNLVHLFDRNRLDVLACDMRSGKVLALSPYQNSPSWRELGKVPAPAHAEVVDLDGDGIPDVLVACLGSFFPTDGRVGSVVWLRGRPDGSFTPVPLLEGVGRVADVQAADFNGDGKLDLVVAVFGWRKTGEVLYLENRTTDWSHPVFEPHVVDDRHGSIHVPVCDLNGDGRPDFVALISQEHEEVVAFLNEGGGRFRKETVYAAAHPAWGSSGIQVVDLDGDGDLDILYSNGDSLDNNVLKPYHGVGWLENRGSFPFTYHRLADMHGAERAVAADLDGDGLLDVLAVSFLPGNGFARRSELGLDAVLLLRQVRPGVFESHSLETGTCDHPTCAAGDLFGDGKVDLVIGNHYISGGTASSDAVVVWRNVAGR
jgi:FG-GAP-like repeat